MRLSRDKRDRKAKLTGFRSAIDAAPPASFDDFEAARFVSLRFARICSSCCRESKQRASAYDLVSET